MLSFGDHFSLRHYLLTSAFAETLLTSEIIDCTIPSAEISDCFLNP